MNIEKGVPSKSSKFLEGVLKVVLASKRKKTVEDTLKNIASQREINKDYRVPEYFKRMFDFAVTDFSGNDVCIFGKADAPLTVLYFHGGSFMFQPLIVHYRYVEKMSRELNARVYMFIYPKAPDNTYKETLNVLCDFYKSIIENTPPENIVFMGDSAGANLTMCLSEYLIEQGLPLPKHLFAFSPCVDLTLENPQIENIRDIDPILNVEDVKIKLATYVGDGNPHDPLISPLYIDFSRMPDTTIFAGTHEILVIDARKLIQKCNENNWKIRYYEYKNMNHAFSIFPIPESEECLKQIEEVLAED